MGDNKLRRKPRTKREFIERESLTWLDLTQPVLTLPNRVWMMPGAAGDWSLKDVWAHLADWMKETRRVMPVLLAGKNVPANIQAFNREHYEQNQKLTLDAARGHLERERKRFLAVVNRMPEEMLLSHRYIYGWVSYATYHHYAEHFPGIVRFARLMKSRLRREKISHAKTA